MDAMLAFWFGWLCATIITAGGMFHAAWHDWLPRMNKE